MRSARDLSSWSNRPLCRRYVLGIFHAVNIRLRAADHLSNRSVHWGVGCLLDDDIEPLGVWIAAAIDGDVSRQIAADLQWRGVERIWHVTGGDTAPVLEGVAQAFSGTSVFSSGERSRPIPVAPTREALRSAAELAAEGACEYLIRAIRRHGSFENEAAALDFISGALHRTARRLDRESAIAKGRPRQGSGAQTVPPGH